MRKFDNNSWKQVAKSYDLDEDFDEIYEEHLKREYKQKIKEKDRHALKEGRFF